MEIESLLDGTCGLKTISSATNYISFIFFIKFLASFGLFLTLGLLNVAYGDYLLDFDD